MGNIQTNHLIDQANNRRVSVIIAARGDCPELRHCLNSLISLDYPMYEILLIDDGLTKTALYVAEKFQDKTKIIENDGDGASDARNCGARHASGEYIAFTDADCIVPRNWLMELVTGIEKYPETASCGGAQQLPDDATDFEQIVFRFMQKIGFLTDYIKNDKKGALIPVEHNPSCNVLYRREIYLSLGGFLSGLWPGEDVEFDYRLRKKGYKVLFNPAAIVFHYRVKNLDGFKRMMSRYGTVQGQLVRRYGVFRTIQMVPVLFLSVLFVAILLCSFGEILWLAGALIAGLSGVYIWSDFDLRIFHMLCIGAVKWNFGFLKGLLRGL